MSKQKHFISLSLSSIITPVLSFLIVILLTKKMSPDIYGQYVYIIGFYNFVFHLSAFGFPPSIRLNAGRCNDDLEKIKVVSGSLLFAIVWSLFFLIVALFVSSIFYYFDKSIPYYTILLLLPFALVYVLTAVLDNLLQGLGHLTTLAINRMFPVLIFSFIVGFSIFFDPDMLFFLLMWHLSFLIVYIFVFYSLKKFVSFPEAKEGIKRILYTNKKFGIHVYLGSVLLLAGMQFGPIFISFSTEDKSQIAFYALALTLTAPLAILPQLFSTLYFKEFVKEKKISSKLFTLVISSSLFLGIILFITAHFIVELAYGIEFIEAVLPLQVLTIASLLNGVNLFMERFFHAKGLGEIIRNSAFISGLILLISYLFLVPMYLAVGASIAMLIAAVANSSYKYYKYYIYVKDKD